MPHASDSGEQVRRANVRNIVVMGRADQRLEIAKETVLAMIFRVSQDRSALTTSMGTSCKATLGHLLSG